MQQLLKELFAVYYQDVYNYLYSLSHDAPLSEDLASDVFLEVVKSITNFRGESDIKTWLFAIARHKWFSYLRKKKRQVQTEALSEFYESSEKPPDAQCHDQELAGRIYDLLDAEPERTRSIVLLRIRGFSFMKSG